MARGPWRAVSRGAASWVTAALVLGCPEGHSPVTELVIVVDSEVVPPQLDAVRLLVVTPTAQRHETTAALVGPAAASLPLTIGLRHVSGPLEPVEITATGLSSGSERVRARAITGFVTGESRVVHLVLRSDCLGVACEETATCEAGACVPAWREPGSLPPWRGELPHLDGGRSDAGPERMDGAVDSGPPGDAGPDAGGDAGPPCTCRDTADYCRDGSCYRSDFMCNAVTPCPTGYDCTGTECRCADDSMCGVLCMVDGHCPPGRQCDVRTDTCRRRLTCSADWMCAPTQFCSNTLDGPWSMCLTGNPAGGGPGTMCSRTDECRDGPCYMGVCVESCFRNMDCSADLRCVAGGEIVGVGGGGGVCLAVSPCRPGCEDMDALCVGTTGCVRYACRRTRDCGAGEACTVETGLPDTLTASCRPAMSPCRVDEVLLTWTGSGLSWCTDGLRCWSASPRCAPDYTCTPVSELRLFVGDSEGICARRP